ncbi:MAG: hypothetical protein DYG92_02850 [Leptolyngbya sp. PLA1]|nr:hypothetical protein [Leptolyngbya sp. PLA1]
MHTQQVDERGAASAGQPTGAARVAASSHASTWWGHTARWGARLARWVCVAFALAWPGSLVLSVWLDAWTVSVQVQDNILVVEYQDLVVRPASLKVTPPLPLRLFSPRAWLSSAWGLPTVKASSPRAVRARPLRGGATYTHVVIRAPLSVVSVAALVVYGGLRATRHVIVTRAMRHGCCHVCGYSLAGVPELRCPECGTRSRASKVQPPEPEARAIDSH